MQATPNSETTPGVIPDSEIPPSRPGLKTVLALGGAALAIAALVYAQELKTFLHLT